MKLLEPLRRSFPGSDHVRNVGLSTASNRAVWEFARANGFAILSKDGDFHQLSLLHGAPPKAIWLRVGNASTRQIAATLARHADDLAAFLSDEAGALLVLGG